MTTTTTTTIVAATQLLSTGIVAVSTLILMLLIREITSSLGYKTPEMISLSRTAGIVSIPLIFSFMALAFSLV